MLVQIMSELEQLVDRMVFESFGVPEKHYESHIATTTYLLRPTKYIAPPSATAHSTNNVGANIHTDKSFSFRIRFWMRELGNPVVRHTFREANSIAHLLGQEGMKKATPNQLVVLPTLYQPLAYNILLDKQGRCTSEKCLVMLVMF
ncbi:uncharacterized protein LOC132048339 [Lycium ferocissimum]|uniref:uncharacterized protein LOC132048339 n=1 Tax=Lycium ferocissimum TaxID=112874 RepID=UPI002815D7AD|nr:uncharacterized protein LOC132048339 [Lycium ferocissimum]